MTVPAALVALAVSSHFVAGDAVLLAVTPGVLAGPLLGAVEGACAAAGARTGRNVARALLGIGAVAAVFLAFLGMIMLSDRG